jgi:prepilin-type processing-associated H-X9-DG protein
MNPDHYSDGLDPSDDWSMYSGHQDDNHRVTHVSARPLRDRPGLTNRISFGSAHASGFQVAMCDGSVRSIEFAIDPEVHRRLGVINDDLPVALP